MCRAQSWRFCLEYTHAPVPTAWRFLCLTAPGGSCPPWFLPLSCGYEPFLVWTVQPLRLPWQRQGGTWVFLDGRRRRRSSSSKSSSSPTRHRGLRRLRWRTLLSLSVYGIPMSPVSLLLLRSFTNQVLTQLDLFEYWKESAVCETEVYRRPGSFRGLGRHES